MWSCRNCKPVNLWNRESTNPPSRSAPPGRPILVLVLAGAQHQVLDGFARVFAVFEDELHLLGDRHLDAVLAREPERGAAGADTFRNFAAKRGQNLGELAPCAELITNGAVAASEPGAGENEVADAGEAGERFAPPSAGDSEAGDLCDAAGDERGGGVVSEADADRDACGDGDDVFECAAEFDADDIGGGVKAEGLGGELALDQAAMAGSSKATVTAVGWPCGDFLREAGAAERADRKRRGRFGAAAITWVMRRKVSFSTPLVALTRI